MLKGFLATSWYAIRLNEKYWLGHHAVDPSGSAGVLAPSMSGAMLLPIDADQEVISRFRNLAKENGGQIVRLNLDMTTMVDEMLRSQFEPLEKFNDEGELPGGQNASIQ